MSANRTVGTVRKRPVLTSTQGSYTVTNPNYNPMDIGIPRPPHNYGPSTFNHSNGSQNESRKKRKIMPPSNEYQQILDTLPETTPLHTVDNQHANEILFKGAYTNQKELEENQNRILRDENPGFILTIQGDGQEDVNRYIIELGPDGNKKWTPLNTGGKRCMRSSRKKRNKRTVRKQRSKHTVRKQRK